MPGEPDNLIDCDVHELIASAVELLPYVGPEWRPYLEYDPTILRTKDFYVEPPGFEQEAVPATSAERTDAIRGYLDGCGIRHAVLSTNNQAVSILPQSHYAAVVARAYNTWLAENVLAADERLLGSITIAAQEPELAAAEIARLGDDPRFVQVAVPITSPSQPWGHPSYDPIWRACVDHDLPVAMHLAPSAGLGGRPNFAGWPRTFVEWRSQNHSLFQSQLISMVVRGTFEKFAELKVVMVEGGFAWVPSVLWRLDQSWRGVRFEAPWLRRPPSDYVRDNVRFTTNPFPAPDDLRDLNRVIEMLDSDEMLLFGSGYPRGGWDRAEAVSAALDERLRAKVMWENASTVYRLPTSIAAGR